MMNEDRQMVAEAVLEGLIGPEHLTDSEIEELEILASDLVMEQLMDDAAERGCSVFEGIEGDILQ